MILKLLKQIFKRPKAKSSAWDAAGSGRHLLYWQPGNDSINLLLLQHMDSLRNRSRNMVRKNPYAANIVDTLVANCIGTGIKPQSKTLDADFRKQVQALWLTWTDEADSNQTTNFYGLQAAICRSMIEGGECLVRFRVRRKEDGLTVPLQLQILEAEHLDHSMDKLLANGFIIQGGIEFNPLGQRVAYYLYQQHPGENLGMKQSVRVPAYEVLHIYRMDRPGQIRGEPWLSRVLLKLYELDQYDDAELVRKKTAAMFAGFITRLDPESNFMGEAEHNEQGVAMAGLEPGEDVKFSEPSDVGGNYTAFMHQQLRSIAAGMGITYEQLSGDLTEVNYSSIEPIHEISSNKIISPGLIWLLTCSKASVQS